MKICEIFYSLQGEGFHTGKAAIFIRFYGCNLQCDFCDEPLHKSHFTNYTTETLIQNIQAFPSKFIVLTGGEPSLYNLNDLILTLQEQGYYIAVETNGLNPANIATANWITYSPKEETKIRKNYGDEIKFIIDSQFNEQLITTMLPVSNSNLFLQPKADKEKIVDANVKRCCELVKKYPQTRLSLQIHKYLNIN